MVCVSFTKRKHPSRRKDFRLCLQLEKQHLVSMLAWASFRRPAPLCLWGWRLCLIYRLIYRYILVPLHILRPHIVEDDPAPHRFAQGVATVFLLVSTLVLCLSHATVLGWTLDLIVFVLSGINLFVGFCAGCFVYYHLGRLGIIPRVRYRGSFHWRGV